MRIASLLAATRPIPLISLSMLLSLGPQQAAFAQSPANPPATAPADRINFSADTIHYDNDADVVEARGNVVLRREAIELRADGVRWDRKTGKLTADGNIRITNPEGDRAYGEKIELTDTLRDGMIENLLVVLENGARLAAKRGTLLASGNMALDRAAYTPYSVDAVAPGETYNPSWQIRAVRVYYNRTKDRVQYDGARIEIFGLPLLPLPGLSHQASNRSGSGLLVPEIRIDRVNGFEFAAPYYLRIDDNRDATITPHVYTDAAPMLEGEYRALTGKGAYRINAYATYSSVVPVAGQPGGARDDFRGYLETVGKFQVDPNWSLRFSGRVTTDRTFMRRYDISRDDRLRSTFEAERIGGSSYLSIAGWAVQTLRANDRQGLQPIAIPVIDFRQRLTDPWLGGQFELQLNSMAVARTAGQDTQRAFAGVRWDLRRLTTLGQEVTITGLARGDIYHSSENLLTAVPGYRGKSGWQGRGIAAAAIDMRWPFIGDFLGGTQQLVPRLQLVATPPIRNLSVPNEDARAFDLEDSNIFALNRFPGHDRFEDGARITYGIDWTFNRPGLAVNTVIGQSYRLSNKVTLFPNGTGLTSRTSDIVGRTTFAWRDTVRLTHRFRLDKDNMAVRRNEFDATFGSRRTYALIGYLRLNRDITNLAEDLQDREEVRVGGRIGFAKNWSIFGSAIVDLTSRAEDPLNGSDGFEPVRHRLGIAYDDAYLSLGITWRRDYEDTGDARRGNSFLFRVGFRNLGF
jgi:LPS-assembly protein